LGVYGHIRDKKVVGVNIFFVRRFTRDEMLGTKFFGNLAAAAEEVAQIEIERSSGPRNVEDTTALDDNDYDDTADFPAAEILTDEKRGRKTVALRPGWVSQPIPIRASLIMTIQTGESAGSDPAQL
jgi:hypothetical protein